MIKKIVAAGLLSIVALLCSCQTSPVIWDDSYPEEQLSTVRFWNMNIDSYNGIGVTKFNFVKIPAGETRLGGMVRIQHTGDVIFTAHGLEWMCNFEAGKEYTLIGAAREMKWGVVLYDTIVSKEINAEHEIAFIPFVNQPVF